MTPARPSDSLDRRKPFKMYVIELPVIALFFTLALILRVSVIESATTFCSQPKLCSRYLRTWSLDSHIVFREESRRDTLQVARKEASFPSVKVKV
jgi:hypothetical protein